MKKLLFTLLLINILILSPLPVFAVEYKLVTIHPATEREDGMPLLPSEIQMHRIYVDKNADDFYETTIEVPYDGSGNVQTYQLERLANDYGFVVTTVDKDGRDSVYSLEHIIPADPALTLPALPPKPPIVELFDIAFIEAEDFVANTAQGAHEWLPVVMEGNSGDGSMVAMPNSDLSVPVDYLTNAPRLDYEVLFNQAGTHYIWVRGKAENPLEAGRNNSAHVGLNGAASATSEAVQINAPVDWVWGNTVMTGEVATIEVPSAGKHIVNVWMREDGFILDAMMLTSDPNFQSK